jgi:signal transduction histidine kinase
MLRDAEHHGVIGSLATRWADGCDAARYRGPDRRQPVSHIAAMRHGRISEVFVIGALSAAAIGAARLLYGHAKPLALYSGLTMLAGSGLCLIGVLLLIGWRLSGSRRAAYAGMGLALLGLAQIPFVRLATMSSPTSARIGITTGHLVLGATACAVLISAARGPQVDSGLSWLRLITVSGSAVALAAALGVGSEAVMTGSGHAHLLTRVLGAATGLIYIGTGVALGSSDSPRRQLAERAGAGLGLFGASWLVQSIGNVANPSAVAALAVTGLVVMLMAVRPEIARTFTMRSRSDASVRERWETAEALLAEHERSRAQVRHEVRNALFGVEGALVTLQRHRDALSERDAAELTAAVEVELRRAQQLLSPPQPAEVRCAISTSAVTDVWSTVRRQVVVARAAGQAVTLEGQPGLYAAVEPDALIEVVETLLRNCSVHAPGAAVRIMTRRTDGRCRIAVSDDGPGIPSHCSDRAFQRGWRATASTPGEGLGLYVARRLLRSHGGDVTIDPSVVGARVEVDLPLAAPVSDDARGIGIPAQATEGRQGRRVIA